MASKKGMVIDTSDAAWKKTEAQMSKMSKAAAAHLVDFEAGVSADAKKKRTITRKTNARKKK